jgi:site-specific recombinase XerD
MESPYFTHELKASSQRTYRIVLMKAKAEHGHRSAVIPPEKAERLIEKVASTSPSMANLTLSVMHRLMWYAKKRRLIKANPFDDIEMFATGEHWCWTEEELAQFEQKWPLGTRERLIYEVLLCTTQRVSDAAEMNRTKITTEIWEGVKLKVMHVVQIKTGVELHIPLLEPLEAAMKAYPTNGLALIGSKIAGKKLTANYVGELMADAIDAAELPQRCVAHGLRKASMRRMAEMGFTPHQIQAWSGHKTLKEIEHYTKQVEQKKMAMAGIGVMAQAQQKVTNLRKTAK